LKPDAASRENGSCAKVSLKLFFTYVIMKIAYLLTIGTPIGGAQIHVRDLSQWLCVNGHECHVLCGNPGGFEKQFEKQSVEFHVINSLERPIQPLKDIKAVTDIVRFLKKKTTLTSSASIHPKPVSWEGQRHNLLEFHVFSRPMGGPLLTGFLPQLGSCIGRLKKQPQCLLEKSSLCQNMIVH